MIEQLLQFERLLQLCSAVCWTIAYIFIIMKGFQDRTIGVPFAALCANFAWELLFTFVFPPEPLQQAINFIWLCLDFIIVGQFIFFARPQSYFNMKWVVFLSSLALSFLLIIGITEEFNDYVGKYSAFAANLMMSLLFIQMVLSRGILGQSLEIAISKMLGTLFASILLYSLYPQSRLLLIMYLAIFVLDAVYMIFLWKQVKQANKI